MEAPAVTEDAPADGEEAEEDGEGDVLSSEAPEDGEGEGKEDGAASPAMEVVAAQEGDAEGADKETTEAIAAATAIDVAVDAVGAVAVAAARDAPVDAAEGVAVTTVSEGATPAVHPDTDVQLDMTEGVEGGVGDGDSEDGGMENDGDGDDGNRSDDGSDRGDDEQEADDDEQDGSARTSDMGNDDNDDDEDPDLAALRMQVGRSLSHSTAASFPGLSAPVFYPPGPSVDTLCICSGAHSPIPAAPWCTCCSLAVAGSVSGHFAANILLWLGPCFPPCVLL